MIRAQTKRVVRAVYAFRCGYCRVSEAQCGAELTYDHFRPQSQGGTDDVANLVYACHACTNSRATTADRESFSRNVRDLAWHFGRDQK
jgi:predicted restriction endonuclease